MSQQDSSKKTSNRGRWYLITAASLWLVVSIGGVLLLQLHATQPGRQVDAPTEWPSATQLSTEAGVPRLLVFLHPYCPCSKATLDELQWVLEQRIQTISVHVLFVLSGREIQEWNENQLWRQVAQMPRAQPFLDVDAREARLFNAHTSGYVILYDASGRRVFQGGITPSRGHAGDSIGRQTLIDLLQGKSSQVSHAPIFGCALFSDGAAVKVPSNR